MVRSARRDGASVHQHSPHLTPRWTVLVFPVFSLKDAEERKNEKVIIADWSIDWWLGQGEEEGKKGSLNFIYKSMIKAKNIDNEYSYDYGMTGILNSCDDMIYDIWYDMKRKMKNDMQTKDFISYNLSFFARKKTRNSKSIFLLRCFFHFFIFLQFWFEILYFLIKIEKWKQFSITIMQNVLMNG